MVLIPGCFVFFVNLDNSELYFDEITDSHWVLFAVLVSELLVT